MDELTHLHADIAVLDGFSKLRYSKENPMHEKMLYRLWKNLKGTDLPTDQRLSTIWVDIGF
jgi:hypothetical protein